MRIPTKVTNIKPPVLALALGMAIIPGMAHAQEIDAGIESPGNQVFLVRNDRGVMQYDTTTTNLGSGPNDLSQTNLGPYMQQLTASFNYGGVKYLFLRTGQYVGLDANNENVVQQLSYIDNNNWPGLAPYRNKIDAALRFKGNSILFFLNDGQYIEYDMALKNIAFGPIAMNGFTLPSLQNVAGDITGAARWDNNRAVIFLKGQKHMWFNFRGVNASGSPTPNAGSQFCPASVQCRCLSKTRRRTVSGTARATISTTPAAMATAPGATTPRAPAAVATTTGPAAPVAAIARASAAVATAAGPATPVATTTGATASVAATPDSTAASTDQPGRNHQPPDQYTELQCRNPDIGDEP